MLLEMAWKMEPTPLATQLMLFYFATNNNYCLVCTMITATKEIKRFKGAILIINLVHQYSLSS